MPDRDNVKAVAAALAIVGAALLAWSLLAGTAHAQFASDAVITVPGSVTQDQPTESNTADILTQDTLTANSVTTGGGGGAYNPNASYISSLDSQLFSGINSQNFAHWFPGWEALPPDATHAVSIPMTNTVLTTYGQALALAQSQEQELEGEDFSKIETTSSSAPALLEAMQANTEAQLQTAQEIQYLRQLVATLITVEATKAGEELNERAQEHATTAKSFNLGIAP